MSNKIFVDTAGGIALLNTSDVLHQSAKQVMHQLQQQQAFLVTTDFVLLEVADALSAPAVRARTVAFISGLRQLNVLQILPVSQALLNQGWQLYSQRPDKEWGLTDCTSFVVMTQDQITIAFTSDHHFQQAGFIKLM